MASAALRLVPVRYIVVVMIFFGMVFNYMLRVNINLAIVAMVNHTALPRTNITRSDECGGNASSTELKPQRDGPFVWDENTAGLILGSLFYGLVCTQLVGGRAAELLSAKHTFGVGLLLSGVLTVLTPIAAQSDWRLLVALRVVMGVALGVTFPASYVLLGAWVPLREMNFLVVLAHGGGDLGTAFTLPMASAIIEHAGWQAVFYIQGCFAFVWFAAWTLLVTSSPEQHWFISAEEREMISASIGPRVTSSHDPLPWRAMLTSSPVWAYFAVEFGGAWIYYSLLSDLPQYFSSMLGEDISDNALFNSLPYLGLWLHTLLFGYLSDRLLQSGSLRVLTVRRLALVVAHIIPSLLLAAIAFLGCRTAAVEALLVLTIVLLGANNTLMVVPLDMAPNYAGTISGLTGTLTSVTGFLGPQVAAALTEGRQTLARWRTCFLIAAGLGLACSAVGLVGISVEELPWNRPAGKETTKTSDVSQAANGLALKAMGEGHEKEEVLGVEGEEARF